MSLRKGELFKPVAHRAIEEDLSFFDDSSNFAENDNADRQQMITIALILSSVFGVLLILGCVFAFCPSKIKDNNESSVSDEDTTKIETDDALVHGQPIDGDENMKLWLRLLEKRRMGFIRESIGFKYLRRHGASCGVCRAELQVGEKVGYSVSNSKCKHIFHPECLTRWLLNHNNCPVCHNKFWNDDESATDEHESVDEDSSETSRW